MRTPSAPAPRGSGPRLHRLRRGRFSAGAARPRWHGTPTFHLPQFRRSPTSISGKSSYRRLIQERCRQRAALVEDISSVARQRASALLSMTFFDVWKDPAEICCRSARPSRRGRRLNHPVACRRISHWSGPIAIRTRRGVHARLRNKLSHAADIYNRLRRIPCLFASRRASPRFCP
jgi:hypothetical protein